MPFADVNGQHLYFEDSGGSGPVVIFSHGYLMDHEMLSLHLSPTGTRRMTAWRYSTISESTAPFSPACPRVAFCP